jgi:hypothetical protein
MRGEKLAEDLPREFFIVDDYGPNSIRRFGDH